MLLILELKFFGKTTFGHKKIYYYCRLQKPFSIFGTN